MPAVDLTPFGFTPTESLVYRVLLQEGPGTGYAIARAAGLARANAYSALEGLVSKGAARAEDGRPRRYRPEAPAVLLARISNDQGAALDRLSEALAGVNLPGSPAIVEIASPRGALQILSHEIARATASVALVAPADAYPLLAPAIRRAVAALGGVELFSSEPVALDFASVERLPAGHRWPGTPLVAVVDDRGGLIASRDGKEVRGHWSGSPWFVAAARLTIERLRTVP
ncbi:MAG TPA: helix-turn-helix domain-containing protein [Gemmatimonadales bacterium]|nr:helix-turn-helix domain-containing protein [Gemmatimonadales bacterium]